MKIEFVYLCPIHQIELSGKHLMFCLGCRSSIPSNKALQRETKESAFRRVVALKEGVEWRCPTHHKALELNHHKALEITHHGALDPTGLREAGNCRLCRDRVWLRDAVYELSAKAQAALNHDFWQQYENEFPNSIK